MNTPIIFDGRNQYNGKRLIERGFDYQCVGKCFEGDKIHDNIKSGYTGI